jgi:hypothetical protein
MRMVGAGPLSNKQDPFPKTIQLRPSTGGAFDSFRYAARNHRPFGTYLPHACPG